MPFAVTHMLVPMIGVDVFRDNILKIKKKDLPNKYVLLAGLFGLLPDIDVPLSLFIFGDLVRHRTLTHTIWVPLIFLTLTGIFLFLEKDKWFKIMLMCFIGVSSHIMLDMLFAGTVTLFFPLNEMLYGINIFPISEMYLLYSAMDAVLLWVWFLRMEFKSKVQDII